MVFRILYGCEHGFISCRAIDQQFHFVAHHQRAADNLRFQRQMFIEDIGLCAICFLSLARIALLCWAVRGPCAPSSCTGCDGCIAMSGTMEGIEPQPASSARAKRCRKFCYARISHFLYIHQPLLHAVNRYPVLPWQVEILILPIQFVCSPAHRRDKTPAIN